MGGSLGVDSSSYLTSIRWPIYPAGTLWASTRRCWKCCATRTWAKNRTMTIRLQGDFNGLFGDILCLSHADTCLDEKGSKVTLADGMQVVAFERDCFDDGSPALLVARGIATPSPEWLECRGSLWCLRIDELGVRHVASLDDA